MKKLVLLAVLIMALSASIAGAASLTMAADNGFWAYWNPTFTAAVQQNWDPMSTPNIYLFPNWVLSNVGTDGLGAGGFDGSPTYWSQAKTATGLTVNSGKNWVYVYAANWLDDYPTASVNPAAVLGRATGDASFITDTSWEYWIPDAENSVDPTTADGWASVTSMGTVPVSPWGGSVNPPVGGGAEWIWSKDTRNQPTYNDFPQRVWLRKSFEPVPEASTLVGFGSALLMAGPGMVGWLRRRK